MLYCIFDTLRLQSNNGNFKTKFKTTLTLLWSKYSGFDCSEIRNIIVFVDAITIFTTVKNSGKISCFLCSSRVSCFVMKATYLLLYFCFLMLHRTRLIGYVTNNFVIIHNSSCDL